VLLEPMELYLVLDARSGKTRQRRAQLSRAAVDPPARDVRLPDDVFARSLKEGVDSPGLVRVPELANQVDRARHGAEG
jgi:hypothetical protein